MINKILNEKEKAFLIHWEKERLKPQKNLNFILIGIRNASVLVTLIMLSLLTGWYKRITLMTPGLLISFLIGIFITITFITAFTVYYNIENNEQRYLELKKYNI